MAKKKTEWRRRFRISVLNEDTLNEVWHIRLSRAGAISALMGLLLLCFALIALLVWLTPLKNYLPGYNEDLRHDLVTEIARVDSMQHHLDLQAEYLTVVRNIMAGEVSTDSVMPLDSMAILEHTKLLEEKSVLMQEFMEEQEAKGRDNLSLFAVQGVQTVPLLFQPQKNNTVVAVLSGTVIALQPQLNGLWTIIVQHADGYISQSGNLKKPLKQVGQRVGVGEPIGLTDSAEALQFTLWHNGEDETTRHIR